MQVLQAGEYKFLMLELDPEFVANIAKQAGFEYRIEENRRTLSLELLAPDRQAPLLLFDAADPGNLGWFSRCQFYVDGRNGSVLQTPIAWPIRRTVRAGPSRRESKSRSRKSCPLLSGFRASSL